MRLKKATVLVVDDDPDILTAVRLLLRPLVEEITTEKNPANLPSLLKQRSFDVILLDMNFKSALHTGNEGLYWLHKIKEMRSEAAVVMITAYGDIDLAIRSVKEGAFDFVVKPWHNDKLLTTLTEALDQMGTGPSGGAKGFPATASDAAILGESEAMQEIFLKIRKVAPTDANVLILGENGTGKELIAKALHQQSLRASKPFVKVDVGALSESLFESELFGHTRGAFTDAREERAGRFEAAHGGTIFLDEIGNISLPQQAKLLSVLQNRQVIRVGANEPKDVDVRLICATNVPLADLAKQDRFRKDLIYRINTVELVVPPLRKRGPDILLLAHHFAAVYARKYLKPVPELGKAAQQKLLQYPFPGNVRELQHALERAIIMAEGSVLKVEDLLFSPIESMPDSQSRDQETNLEALEKQAICQALLNHGGNLTRASKELGITRTALYRRMTKYGL